MPLGKIGRKVGVAVLGGYSLALNLEAVEITLCLWLLGDLFACLLY